MKGKISKINDSWIVESDSKEFDLHPDDVNEIIDLSERFDNIEARIAAWPDVEFEVVENKKMSGPFYYAKLIKL